MDQVCEYVEHRFQSHYAPIVVVAEGAHPKSLDTAVGVQELDEFGHARFGGMDVAIERLCGLGL